MPKPAQSPMTWFQMGLHILFSVTVLLSGLWLMLALWFQQPFGQVFTYIAIGLWFIFSCSVLGIYWAQRWLSHTQARLIYLILFTIGLIWYFSIEPRQDRQWNPEVSQVLSYTRIGDQIQLHQVRNFDWQSKTQFVERWETREFSLQDIQGVNILTSYWMGPQIAHTLVSFDIREHAPITFSIEIRKEQDEDFSALGGFFRKYELSLVAADEKDIVFTRSHIRGEQVYFFPTTLSPELSQALFLEYLNKADQLAQQPKWYNTLTSNCTTIVFDMMQAVTNQALPIDYRLLASGYLPNYLHDLNALPYDWSMKTWYQRAHINAKMPKRKPISSSAYSQLIREGLVKNYQ